VCSGRCWMQPRDITAASSMTASITIISHNAL
jgi:hypothetical protein